MGGRDRHGVLDQQHHNQRIKCSMPGCSITFSSTGHLKRHLLTHKEKSFKCAIPDCPKVFRRKDNLQMHMVTHKKRWLRAIKASMESELEKTTSPVEMEEKGTDSDAVSDQSSKKEIEKEQGKVAQIDNIDGNESITNFNIPENFQKSSSDDKGLDPTRPYFFDALSPFIDPLLNNYRNACKPFVESALQNSPNNASLQYFQSNQAITEIIPSTHQNFVAPFPFMQNDPTPVHSGYWNIALPHHKNNLLPLSLGNMCTYFCTNPELLLSPAVISPNSDTYLESMIQFE